jgi:hypothetical protein
VRRQRAGGPVRALPPGLVDALVEDWEEHGPAAIERLRAWSPERYVGLFAALVAAGSSSADEVAPMTDEQLRTELARTLIELDAAGALPPNVRIVRPAEA